MGKKNSYAKQLQDWRDYYRETEQKTYIQYMQDIFCIVLNDPNTMGKDVLGEKRLLKVLESVWRAYDIYLEALKPATSPEADYYQAKMDDKLKNAFKENFVPFHERYQCLVKPK